MKVLLWGANEDARTEDVVNGVYAGDCGAVAEAGTFVRSDTDTKVEAAGGVGGRDDKLYYCHLLLLI